MTILIVSNTDQLECDFDKYRTNIYSCLQERDWNGVIYQSHFFPAEARTYVYRRDPKTNALRWRVLPIHGAILAGAPLNVVEALLTAYPDGAKSVDDQGMLPIHLAIKKHADLETIYSLLAAFPGCVDVRSGNQGLTPFQMAKKSSSPYKRSYQMAFKKGSSTYAAVTGTFGDLLCGVDLKSLMNTMPLIRQQEVSGATTYVSTVQPGTVTKRQLLRMKKQ